MELIYCAGGNRKYVERAIKYGWLYGAQLPDTIYYPIHFADQNPNHTPTLERYACEVDQKRPRIASVIDWQAGVSWQDVITWCEVISPFVETLIVVPKIIGTVEMIPKVISGRRIRLGYSVPTRHSKTNVPISEFRNREIHLLGGSPIKQMQLYQTMNVVSADGNYIQNMAKRGQFWSEDKVQSARNKHFPTLREASINVKDNVPYIAFEMSARSLMETWQKIIKS